MGVVMPAGYYPSILRVEHPAARYQEAQGGTVEIDPKAAELRFYDRQKGGPSPAEGHMMQTILWLWPAMPGTYNVLMMPLLGLLGK